MLMMWLQNLHLSLAGNWQYTAGAVDKLEIDYDKSSMEEKSNTNPDNFQVKTDPSNKDSNA